MAEPTASIVKERQTALGLYVTAKEAYERWKADPENVVILDVRAVSEIVFVGHPTMAWQIPLTTQSDEWDAAKGQFPMAMLPDFVSRVKSVFAPDRTLMAMCRSGGRSAMAINLLAQAGFTNVYNILDGMEGDLVNDVESTYAGQRMRNGWKNAGCPWTYDVSLDRMVLPQAG